MIQNDIPWEYKSTVKNKANEINYFVMKKKYRCCRFFLTHHLAKEMGLKRKT